MILKNLIFSSHLPIYRQEIFSSILQNKYHTTLMQYTLIGTCALEKMQLLCCGHVISLHDFVSDHIKPHSTKFTNCTYLLPYFWLLTFLIYQTLFIYYWELFFQHYIAEKRTSRYLIYWEKYHPLLYFIKTQIFFSSAPALQLLSNWF